MSQEANIDQLSDAFVNLNVSAQDSKPVSPSHNATPPNQQRKARNFHTNSRTPQSPQISPYNDRPRSDRPRGDRPPRPALPSSQVTQKNYTARKLEKLDVNGYKAGGVLPFMPGHPHASHGEVVVLIGVEPRYAMCDVRCAKQQSSEKSKGVQGKSTELTACFLGGKREARDASALQTAAYAFACDRN
jgi:hypothetical protein